MNCPACGREIIDAQARFCPYCAVSLDAGELASILARADAETDQTKKRELLLEAKSRFPGDFEVEKRLLFQGRLGEKGGKPDFYRIPFWPLIALERPGEFSSRERSKMLDCFFGNPEIARVSALSPDPEAFEREYYEEMGFRYVDMFLKEANSNKYFLGFRRSERDVMGRCRAALNKMLINLRTSKDVPDRCRVPMEEALEKGFKRVFDKNGEQ
ncbi:MAG: zinc ribbon domain-containing protein [Clostridiales bacterium]|nr:zinc ribbon domain-containing protein [Clostridiales bacterium]